MASFVFQTYKNQLLKYLEQKPYHMPASYGVESVEVTVDGVPLQVQSIDRSVEAYRCGVEYEIRGFVTDEAARMYRRPPSGPMGYSRSGGKTMNFHNQYGSGIGVSADSFLSQPIGWSNEYADPITDIQRYTERMMGGGKMREGTQGSYAYGVAQLAEGLAKAVDQGWITDEEAKAEMRGNIATTEYKDRVAEQEKSRIEALEKELEELREKQAGTS